MSHETDKKGEAKRLSCKDEEGVTYAGLDVCLGSCIGDGDGDDHVECKVLAAKARLHLDVHLHSRPAQLADQRRHLHSQVSSTISISNTLHSLSITASHLVIYSLDSLLIANSFR